MSLALGILPSELERRMTGADLAEWEAFERAFGPIVPGERIDLAQAMLSSVIARSHGAKGDLTPEKFLPVWQEPPPREQTADELVEVLRTWTGKKGGKRGD